MLEREIIRSVFASCPDAIVISDLNGKIVECNRSALDMAGYSSKDELIGKNGLTFVATKDHERAKLNLMKTLKQGVLKNVEYTILTKDGHEFQAEVSLGVIKDPSGNPTFLVAIIRDITELKRVEKTLRESEERYRLLFETSPIGIGLATPDGKIISANKAMQAITGYSNEELKKTNLADTYQDPEDRKKLLETLNRYGIVINYSARLKRKDGTPYDALLSVSSIHVRGKDLLQTTCIDITERKRLEEEVLRESEEKFNVIYKNAIDGIHLVDMKDKRFFDGNKAFCQMLGISREELNDTRVTDIHPAESLPYVMEQFEKAVKKEIAVAKDIPVKRKDGTVFYVDVSAAPTTYRGKKYLVGIFRDITERKQMEQQLKDAERLATIGEVAAMVGHDLRNPLQGIAGATYYLKTKFGSKVDNESRRMLEIIEENIEYSDKIINDLLEYSRELHLELADTSAKSLVKGALNIVKVPINVRIVDSTMIKPRVRADAGKMKRAFVNLIENAVEAMPKGGTLKIASKKSNGNLEITFSDTGIGMPKQVMEKIWSPLFTTKSKGIGFGLPICKRIVEAHGGSISVESTGEKGSTFTVKLPIEPTMKG